MEAKVYDTNAKEKSTISLPESLFGLPWNSDLVHQVATSLTSSKRKAIAHTKNRAEVRGGGKKPWQQKGTGRARHGSTRSPIWVGGGITHGPRNEKNFEKKISKKMKAKAFYTILSRKFRDGEILFVDSIAFAQPKTKLAIGVMKKLEGVKGFEQIFKKKNNSAVIALGEKSVAVEKAISNLSNMEVIESRNLHPLALLQYKYLVIENPEKALSNLPGQGLFGKTKITRVIKEKAPKVKVEKKVVASKKVATKKIVMKKK